MKPPHRTERPDYPLSRLLALIALLLVSSCLAARAAEFSAAEPPAAPSSIETAVTGLTAITVFWSAPVKPGFTGYRVLRYGQLIASPGPGERSFTDQNLTPGQVYHYTVEAIYPDGPAASSHTVAEKIPPVLMPERRYDVVVVI
ncbi:MAG TPA: fibronectin type III domain-containing protein, partial [Armatimonadota bacterium]|nr:fibronectin type III domain-containing protein [Armatimonadota bacterium]